MAIKITRKSSTRFSTETRWVFTYEGTDIPAPTCFGSDFRTAGAWVKKELRRPPYRVQDGHVVATLEVRVS